MGVKYILQYRAHDGVAWQYNIETAEYTGDPIAVRGVSETSTELDYDGDNADDPFNPLIKSTLILNIYNQAQIDINELQQAGDKDFSVKSFRNGQLYWAGFLKPEDIQWNFLTPPQVLTITFMCGLATLDDTPYVHQNLMGTTGSLSRCPMNYIRQILFVNLGIMLPIRWTNSLECTAFLDDFMTGQVQWSPFNEGFYTYQQGVNGTDQGPSQSCGYILAGFLQATQSRIYQAKGKWIIRRVNEVIAGSSIPYKEIPATLGTMTVVHGTENVFQHIGRAGYRFVSENAILTVVQGIKSFKSTYAANIRSNIVPNGNFDILNADLTVAEVLSGGILLYWGSYNTNILVNAVSSLDGQSGFAAEVVNVTGEGAFTMVSDSGTLGKNGLPMDMLTLVKIINFGFMFSAVSGFAVDGEGLIDWSSQPLQFKMIINQGTTQYFLNEFGTWSTTEAWIPIVIDGLEPGDIAQVNFDKFQGVKVPAPPTEPVAGDTCDLQIIWRVKAGQTYVLDNVAISIDNANDVYEVFNDASKNTSTDEISLDISSSFGGYMVSNFMSSALKSGDQSKFNDGTLYSGTLTGINSQAVMRFRYKSSQVLNTDIYTKNGNWSFDEIYTVDTLLGKKFLPLNAKYYPEKCITNIVAIEARNDAVTLRESFYSSNDQQGSN